jgi:hypothetical protein
MVMADVMPRDLTFLISSKVFSIRGVPWSIVARNIIADG